MIKIDLQSYSDYICYAESCKYGNVYPLSIAEGYQQGDIYVNSINNTKNVLFWHFSGFAFISGEYNTSFLESVFDFISISSLKLELGDVLVLASDGLNEYLTMEKTSKLREMKPEEIIKSSEELVSLSCGIEYSYDKPPFARYADDKTIIKVIVWGK